DAFVLGDRDDFVDRSHHGALQGDHRPFAVLFGVALPGASELRGQPAAVPPGGAEAREFPLEDRDAQVGLLFLEVVGGPQPGVSGTDDADVVVGVTGQGGTPFRKPQFAVPEGHRTVAELLRTGDGTHLGCAGDQSHGYVCLPERSRMTPAPSPASVVVSPPPRVPGGRLSRRRGIVAKGQLLPPGRSRAAHSSLSPSPAPRGRDASCPAVCAPVRLGRARRAPRGGPAHTREGGQRAWSWPVPRGPALFW